MITLAEVIAHVPGMRTARRTSSAENAWLGDYATLVLHAPLPAMRVHLNAGEGAAREKHLATGAGLVGRWFAIGDFVQTYDEYRKTHALPAHFTHAALFTLLPGTILNVGLCSALFGHPGGAEQAELVEGPEPHYRQIDGFWSPFAGHA